MINEIKLKKRLEFAIKKSKELTENESAKFLADSIVSLVLDALQEVKVIVPQNKVIVENQHGQFEKCISIIEGHLDLTNVRTNT